MMAKAYRRIAKQKTCELPKILVNTAEELESEAAKLQTELNKLKNNLIVVPLYTLMIV